MLAIPCKPPLQMAQYNIGIDSEKVKGLLVRDEGLKELIRSVHH